MSKIRVRATQIGYYGNKRRFPLNHTHAEAGEPFYLEDITVVDRTGKTVKVPAERQFSAKWMEKVAEGPAFKHRPRGTDVASRVEDTFEQVEVKPLAKPGVPLATSPAVNVTPVPAGRAVVAPGARNLDRPSVPSRTTVPQHKPTGSREVI